MSVVLAVFLLLVVVALCCFLLIRSSPQEIFPGAWSTSSPILLVKAVLSACVRPQGVLPKEWRVEEDGRVTIPRVVQKALTTSQKGWRLDADSYSTYCRVCGYDVSLGKAEPLCYLETSFMRHFFLLITSPYFPLSPLALIHIRQTIITHASMSTIASEPCDLHCEVAEMRVTEKGVEVDMKLDVFSSKARQHMWSGVATLLSRNKQTRSKFKPMNTKESQPFSAITRQSLGAGIESVPSADDYSVQKLSVTAGTGLHYASATGDYNLHHLYPWTARMVGYKMPIAHGMWTLARALAVIQEGSSTLASHPLQITASFKRPLYMPTEACVLYTKIDLNQEILFEVRGKTQRVLHLNGNISCF